MMNAAADPTVSLSLTVKDAAEALRFYARALGAKELLRLTAKNGHVIHAEFAIGNTRIYISGEAADWHAYAMPAGATASCLFTILTDDCDTAYRQAMDAGAQSLSVPKDQSYGMRSALVKDPFGYRWCFGQKIEKG